MSVATFTIKQGDLRPFLYATLGKINSDLGEVEEGDDITNAVVIFNMRKADTEEPVIDGAAVAIDDAATGSVHYEWSAGDTDEPGDYLGEFEVTHADGNPITYPNDRIGFKIKIPEQIS